MTVCETACLTHGPGVFFGRFEKNSSSKKLKTQAKSIKTQVKIPKKLKNRQLHLSLVGGKSSTTIFGLNCTIQYLISDQQSKSQHKYLLTFAMTYNTIQFLVRFHNGFDNCKLKRKTQGHFGEKTQNSSQIQKKTQAKIQKNSKTANSSWDELPKKRPNKTPVKMRNLMTAISINF